MSAEWLAKYNEALDTAPEAGAILASADGEPVKLVVELKEGQPPFIYGRAHVPEIVQEDVKWVLKDADAGGFYGWKTILLPRARADLLKLKKDEIVEGTVTVKSLRVIRQSQSGKSLLCEVCTY